MRRLALEAQTEFSLRQLVESIVKDVWPHDYVSEYAALLNWVRKNIRYIRDPRTIEQVRTPRAVVESGLGDCFTLNTRVIVRDRAGFYRLPSLGELAFGWSDFEALSYNFDSLSWEFCPITAWALRGEREVYRLTLHNGYTLDCTADQKLNLWSTRRNEAAVECLGTAWNGNALTRYQTLLCARQIPVLNRSWRSLEEAWLCGGYAAEGWDDGSHVCLAKSGAAAQRECTSRLEKLGARYSVSKRQKSAYISLLSGPVKDLLRQCGSRALTKHTPENLLSSSREELEAWLDGYARWGDSWVPDPTIPRRSHQRHVAMHTTISDELAVQLKFLYLLLGRPLSGTLVHKHGGLGTHPVWRLWEASGERFWERLPGLTNVGLKSVDALGKAPVCDITVEKNHNFVLANGLLAHNCDDMATLLAALVGIIGGQSRFIAGAFRQGPSGRPVLSHVWCEAFDPTGKQWVVLDPVPGRRVAQMLGNAVYTISMPGVA